MNRPCVGVFAAHRVCRLPWHAAGLLQHHHQYATITINSHHKALRAASAASAAGSSTREGFLLDASIGPGLQLMEQQFSVSGNLLRMIAPADVDAVMDMYISRGVDGDPYWCRVWPSAISLAQQLLQRPELVRGKKVADLGSGLGVAGIAAALAGATEVVLLDREPLALQCGLVSAAASGVCGVQGLEDVQLQQGGSSVGGGNSDSHGGATAEGSVAQTTQQQVATAGLLQMTEIYLQHRMHQQQLEGRQHQALTSSTNSMLPMQLPSQQQQQQQQKSSTGTFRAHAFDWISTDVPERYDVILACDVLYEDTAVEPVAAVVGRLLKPKPGSMLLLADPPNRTAANRERFVDLLASRNSNSVNLLLEESGVYQCDVRQLDPEMVGGVSSQTMPVQFMAFRAAVGNDTISLKM